MDVEAELAKILQQEILIELAKEHGVTPAEMQRIIDQPIIDAIIATHEQDSK